MTLFSETNLMYEEHFFKLLMLGLVLPQNLMKLKHKDFAENLLHIP